MKRRLAVPALIAGLVAMAAVPAFAATINTAANGYVVNFTLDDGMAPQTAAEFPQAQAQAMADALSNGNAATPGTPNGYHNGYNALGFDDPDFGGATRPINVIDCVAAGGCDSGDAPADQIRMPVASYRTSAEACVRLVLGHELFHHTQYEAIDFANWSTWGGDPVEGTARVMQDKVYNDLDMDNGCITYLSEANNYLGSPGTTMWGRSYTTAIFWSYLMERLGADRTEPAVGTDFVREFWQNAEDAGSNRDFLGTLRATIAEFDTNVTLESLFHDFTIANYTKDLDVSALPDGLIYRYLDEQQTGATKYASVPVASVGTIPPNVGPTAVTVSRWASTYLQADIGDCTGVAGFVVDGDRAGVSLVAQADKGVVMRLDKAVTDHFARAILVRTAKEERVPRLGAVITALGDDATVDYRFACGSYTLDIKDPLGTKPAYVGDKGDPNRFVVRLRVQGPTELGTPSVEGLRPTDFQIQVGGDAATVLSGAYVQGEYWLVVQPPSKAAAAPDVQNLVVTLGGVSDTEAGAVRYQIKHLDQVLVIDRSGSMTLPAQSPKIDAARNAASLYVDAARSDDKLGVVSFSGDNTETNDDATLDAMLSTMNTANRDTARAKVLGLVANGWTSIGDGMFKGAGEFPIRGTAVGEDWIVLLSDGMENEGKFWSNVKGGVVAAGIRVDTIALGPLSDQALLQQIATDTGGTYYYVDVSSGVSPGPVPSAAPAPAPAPAAGTPPLAAAPGGPSLANGLADIYSSTLENANDLQRIWDDRATVGAGTTEVRTIDLGEDKIQHAVLSVNWPDPGNPIRVRLTDPFGNDIVNGFAGAEVIEESTHTVIRMPFMDRGQWTVTLDSAGGGDTPYFAALAGQQTFGAGLYVKVGGPVESKRLDAYRWGQEMPIVASITDRDGAIRRADVMSSITHPDGTVINLPLLDDGNHGDGTADDGVYANIYTRTTEYAGRGSDDLVDKPNGSYSVRIVAHGKGNFGDEFNRIENAAFSLFENGDPTPDADGDKVADLYESYHPCMTATDPSDIGLDPDEDGLQSGDEWYFGPTPATPTPTGAASRICRRSSGVPTRSIPVTMPCPDRRIRR